MQMNRQVKVYKAYSYMYMYKYLVNFEGALCSELVIKYHWQEREREIEGRHLLLFILIEFKILPTYKM